MGLWRRSGRAGLVVAVVAATLVGVPAGASASWSRSLGCCTTPTDSSYTHVSVVADGRVWWMTSGTQAQSPPYAYPLVLRSRALTGRRVRSVVLDTPALKHPAPDPGGYPFVQAGVVNYGLRDGRVFAVGQWYVPPYYVGPDGFSRATEGFYAGFDTATGAVVHDEVTPTWPDRLLRGGASTTLVSLAGPAPVGPLRDPLSGAPFPVDATTVSEVAGPYALSYSSSNHSQYRWARGDGTAQVIEIATGKTRYAVTARQITRRAGVSGRPVVNLQPDGSLLTAVTARRSERVRPVAVDPSGRVHRLGRSLRHVGEVGAVIKGSRGLVEVTGRDRVSSALWLVSNTGKRGHRLSRVDGQKFTRDLPSYRDGDAAVWETTGPRDRDGVWVTTRLKCLSLSSRHVPTSKAVR